MAREAYKELSERHNSRAQSDPPAAAYACIWKAHAPLKAQVTAWRAVQNCLPTRDNIDKRVNLDATVKGCCGCSEEVETINHLFQDCEKVVRLWYKVVGWVGLSWVPQRNIALHLLSFVNLMNGKRWKRRLGGLWICFVWVVWKWRNSVLFSHNEWDSKRIKEEIKCRF